MANPRRIKRLQKVILHTAAEHIQRELDCTVVSLAEATHDIRILTLKIDAGGPYDFSAGQYARVQFAGQPGRDFSMASRPGEADLVFTVTNAR